MTLAWILIAAAALLEVWFLSYNIRYHSHLAEREVELDKHEVSLEEREKRNKEDFLALTDMEDAETYKASYVVTEADELKFCTDERIKRHAKKQIAYTIASDITRHHEPEETQTVEGKKMFTYRFKVKK